MKIVVNSQIKMYKLVLRDVCIDMFDSKNKVPEGYRQTKKLSLKKQNLTCSDCLNH